MNSISGKALLCADLLVVLWGMFSGLIRETDYGDAGDHAGRLNVYGVERGLYSSIKVTPERVGTCPKGL